MSAPGSARSTQSAYHRRSSARTAVVWDALRPLLGRGEPLEVLDIGGGTGGFAVGVAELGHHVVVVDPSPDALATLARRSAEAGVADRVRGVQGDLATLAELAPADGADVVLCHGVLEVVDDPRAALSSIHDVLRPGGTLSLLVSQRHAAVLARAMAGHFRQAHELLDADGTGAPAGPPRPPVRAASPPRRSGRCSPRSGSGSPRSTRSGCSATSCPAPWSTSSRGPLLRSRRWRRRSRPVRSTSPWPPRSTPWLAAPADPGSPRAGRSPGRSA